MIWPLWHYRGKVVRVVDGDTLVVHLDLGLRVYTEVSLRLAGINAPEMRQGTKEDRAAGSSARDYLATLLPPGAEVYVRTHKDKQTFNRYVADVFHVGLGAEFSITDEMVHAGHATYAEE